LGIKHIRDGLSLAGAGIVPVHKESRITICVEQWDLDFLIAIAALTHYAFYSVHW
jgi:hypothetical protein